MFVVGFVSIVLLLLFVFVCFCFLGGLWFLFVVLVSFLYIFYLSGFCVFKINANQLLCILYDTK